jgi:prepilin-type N-terminal cleavage/methylation domain-containing protein
MVSTELPLSKGSGFTLVEVVLGLVILSVLMIGASMGLRMGVRAWERGETHAEGGQRIRTVIQILTEEISSADPFQVLSDGQKTYAFHAERNSLSFVSASPRGFSGFVGPALIKYEVVHGGKRGQILTRLETPLLNSDQILNWQRSAHGGSVLLEGLGGVGFFYHRKSKQEQPKGEWTERWDPKEEGGLPDAVVVKIEGQESLTPTQHFLIHAEAEREDRVQARQQATLGTGEVIDRASRLRR